jgi:hypothetical protein
VLVALLIHLLVLRILVMVVVVAREPTVVLLAVQES